MLQSDGQLPRVKAPVVFSRRAGAASSDLFAVKWGRWGKCGAARRCACDANISHFDGQAQGGEVVLSGVKYYV